MNLDDPLITAIQDVSPSASLICDPDGFVVSYNHRFLDLWQLLGNDLTGEVSDLVHGVEIHVILARMLDHLVDQVGFIDLVRRLGENPRANGQAEFLLRDGRCLECHSNAIRGDDGSLLGTLWAFLDLTEARATSARLERLMQLYTALARCNQAIATSRTEQELFDQICLGAVSLGGMKMAWIGKLDVATQRVLPVAWYGSGTDFLDGIEISADAAQPSGRGPIGQVLRENRTFWCQNYMTDPTLAPWHERARRAGWATSGYLPLLCDGVVVGVLSLYSGVVGAFDPAARTLLETVARDLSLGLCHFARAAERSKVEALRAELQHQLFQAQKMESVGHLTSGVAHDFNNILGAMMGHTEMLQLICANDSTPLPMERVNKYLDRIYTSGLRAQHLITHLLEFSRKGGDDDLPVTDVGALIRELATLLHALVPSTIELRYHLGEAPLVRAQPVRLQQVLMNLILNARDAAGPHGRIDVTLARATSAGTCSSCHQSYRGAAVTLTVRDSGAGIPPAVLGRIFEPFFTTKTSGEGTGMGLAVVHGIVHSLGGHVVAHSEPTRGTTVEIRLPSADGATPSVHRVKVAPPRAPPRDLAALRIMVVDDDEAVAGMLADFLAMHGAQVAVYHRSTETLADFEREPGSVDVLITDQTMPGLSGLELARRMLKIRPELPILICSGYSDDVNADIAHQAGVAGFMDKPMELARLLDWISQVRAAPSGFGPAWQAVT